MISTSMHRHLTELGGGKVRLVAIHLAHVGDNGCILKVVIVVIIVIVLIIKVIEIEFIRKRVECTESVHEAVIVEVQV